MDTLPSATQRPNAQCDRPNNGLGASSARSHHRRRIRHRLLLLPLLSLPLPRLPLLPRLLPLPQLHRPRRQRRLARLGMGIFALGLVGATVYMGREWESEELKERKLVRTQSITKLR